MENDNDGGEGGRKETCGKKKVTRGEGKMKMGRKRWVLIEVMGGRKM